ncbi:MAG: NAD-glutamate dehydrogenase [Alphaproteobacteria bacterium]
MTKSAAVKKVEEVDRLIALAESQRMPEAERALFVRYLSCLYSHVPPEDMQERGSDALLGAGLALFRLAYRWADGKPQVRIFNPDVEQHGWQSAHTIIEIVQRDMPFLVDSITTELNRRGLAVHLIVHPVLNVARADDGAITALCEAPGSVPEGRGESHMHIEVDELTSPAELDAVRDGLLAVLNDVALAVADWRKMLDQSQALAEGLSERSAGVAAEEVDEAVAFLRWLAADNFTFLGYRRYSFLGAGDAEMMEVDEGSGLGILRDPDVRIFRGRRELGRLPEEVRHFVRAPHLVQVTKANRRSTVHRGVHLDVISIKRFDDKGAVKGEHNFVGLFTSASYAQRAQTVPFLRAKLQAVLRLAGFPPKSHAAKALEHTLETFPRDEFYQIGVEDLARIAGGILNLQERQRTALFVRTDPFERFVSCFIYCPRDRYDTALRHKFGEILAEAFNGRVSTFYPELSADAVLARVHMIIATEPGMIPDVDLAELEQRIVAASRSWADDLRVALVATLGEDKGLALHRLYAEGLPASYRERVAPQVAVFDLERIDRSRTEETLRLNLYRPIELPADAVRVKLYHPDRPVPLSDVLPMFEHMGLKVLTEAPFRIETRDGATIYVHDFEALTRDRMPIDVEHVKQRFEEAFLDVWNGVVEDDGFNALVLTSGLSSREVSMLRALAKYLRQAGIQYSEGYMAQALSNHPYLASCLLRLFRIRFDPAADGDRAAAEADLLAQIEAALADVSSLDEDRIVRRFLNLLTSILRTNAFQTAADGGPKAYLSFKLDSRKVDGLPLPRPMVEVFVYSPRVEAVHLRGGKVARGGIRWSDRREDFRTEVLGLMKAQMVKNAVIVPVGSKGGFVVKQPPAPSGDAAADRQAQRDEGVACYQTFMRGLLDITDNLVDGALVPPDRVVRHDEDDPYLVVAADKGTATFSDIANGVSQEYGFWLDDAFASGGSAGYDHKAMGITARGAWESVKRHFREIGKDIQSEDFSVVGVGDMAGDVFGNGMLLSEHIRLVGAFNHMHIFIDPDPDPAAGFAERKRLFELPRSSWADYDTALLSAGGAIFERSKKSLTLTPEIMQRFGIASEKVTPDELIHALLTAEVDLLWFGGIGTFVKAAEESHAQVGDKANDALRVDAMELRCAVVGEGANLGFTQRGRIAYALRGGRINTDAIDNSAGVDCSDHEVNIKVLLNRIVAAGDMTRKQRDALLVDMTDEVAELVLQDNYLQTQALSVAQAQAGRALPAHQRLMRTLEREGRLNRAIEFLPDGEAIKQRAAAGRGLVRPELAVLLAYAKIALYDELLGSDLPDDKGLVDDLFRYFPRPLRKRFPDALTAHPLAREIIATFVTNSIVNRSGLTFVYDLKGRFSCSAADVTRAYSIVREVHDLRGLWAAVSQLDNRVPADVQIGMLNGVNRLTDRATGWFLQYGARPLEIAAHAKKFRPGLEKLEATLDSLLPASELAARDARAAELAAAGVPAEAARAFANLLWLEQGVDIVAIQRAAPKRNVELVGAIFFALADRFAIGRLRSAAGRLSGDSDWTRRAAAAVVDELDAVQSDLTRAVLAASDPEADAAGAIAGWLDQRAEAVGRWDSLWEDLGQGEITDLAMLMVARRHLGTLLASA